MEVDGNGVTTARAMNIRHGIQAKVIANRGEKPVGIAQDGIALRAGMTYRFTGYLSPGPRGAEPQTEVTVGLYGDPELSKPYAMAVIPVSGLREVFGRTKGAGGKR